MIFAVLLAALLITSICQADGPSCSDGGSCNVCQHTLPELWLVNTRCAPTCGNVEVGFEQITYHRWDADHRQFVRSSREEFLSEEWSRPTLLFSHGNTLQHDKAMETACWPIYHRLKACPGPKRFVFWSWPSEPYHKRPLITPIKLTRKNLTTKYAFAEYQGYYIAKLIGMMSFAQPITLSGHSYGAVTVISALHYLGGGSLNRLCLDSGSPEERCNLRAAIVSGAIDAHSINPGRRYGQALAPVHVFYNTYNPLDSTLKMWPRFSTTDDEALGLIGAQACQLGPYAHKLQQDRMTEDVKRSHYLAPHLASSRMISAICQTAFPIGENSCNCASCSGNVDVSQPIPTIIETTSLDDGDLELTLSLD